MENMGVIMVKLYSRALLLLVSIGLGLQEGKLFGMQQDLKQKGDAAQQQNQNIQQQTTVILSKQEQELAEIAQLKRKIELNDLIKKSEIIDQEKWDEEVQARAKIFKGILYGLLVPGTALINYNMGNFGINQIGGIVMLVVLIHYGVIHAFLVCLSNGVQHVKQIPLSKAKNLIYPGNKIAVDVPEDLIGNAFDSDSDSDLD